MIQLKGISIGLLVVLALLILQSLGGVFQIRNYKEAVKRVHKLGNVGIGQKRGSFLNGHVVIIACDNNGIITGAEDDPQGVLIRCCVGVEGPGKLTKALGIDLSFNGLDMLNTEGISLLKGPMCPYETAPRVGIGYASWEDQMRPWRFIWKGDNCCTR